MVSLLLALLLAFPLQSISPEEMYGEYITPETRELLDRFDRLEEEIRENEEASRQRNNLALAGAILIGLIPVVVVGGKAIRGKTWRTNPGGTVKGMVIALLGGGVLFALNYTVFLLKIRLGDAFNTGFAFLAVAALLAAALYLLNGRKK